MNILDGIRRDLRNAQDNVDVIKYLEEKIPGIICRVDHQIVKLSDTSTSSTVHVPPTVIHRTFDCVVITALGPMTESFVYGHIEGYLAELANKQGRQLWAIKAFPDKVEFWFRDW